MVAGPRLARPVEGEDGVAALLGGQRAGVVQFLGPPVKAAVHDAGGLRAAARRLVQVAVQGVPSNGIVTGVTAGDISAAAPAKQPTLAS